MASIKAHMEKESENKRFANFIKDTEFTDWEITGIFYAGLHLMSAYLHKKCHVSDEKINRHKKMIGVIKDNCDDKIGQKYVALFKLSLLARYECIDVSSKVEYAKETFHALENVCIGK
jgi:hypothetical protein